MKLIATVQYDEKHSQWKAITRGGTSFIINDLQAEFLSSGDDVYIQPHANYTDCDVMGKAA